MFKKSQTQPSSASAPVERVTSVLGEGINWQGRLSGRGGIRIEGIFEGEIAIKGLLVIGETGKVTCQNVRANKVIVAGTVNGSITTDKLEIRSTGRVYGNVTVSAFSTEEGAFLRGQVTMEEKVDLEFEAVEQESPPPATSETNPEEPPTQ